MTQQRPDDDTGDEIAGGVAVVRTNDAHGPQTPPGSPGKRRRELTLAAVVERARNRYVPSHLPCTPSLYTADKIHTHS